MPKRTSMPVCVGRFFLLKLWQQAEMIDNKTNSRLFLCIPPSHPLPLRVQVGFLSQTWRLKVKKKQHWLVRTLSSLENHHWRGQEMTIFSLLWYVNYKPYTVSCETREIHIFQENLSLPWACVLFHVNRIPVFSYGASMVPAGRKQKTSVLWREATACAATGLCWNPAALPQ